MSERLKYKLTLEVEEFGDVRKFEATGNDTCQGEFADSLAWDIGRMLAIMNDPPSAWQIVRGVEKAEGQTLMDRVAALHDQWDGCHGVEEAVSVTVDLDVLMADSKPEERELAVRIFEGYGFTVKRAKADEDKASG